MYCEKNWMLRIVGGGLATVCLLIAWSLGNASEPAPDSQPPERAEPTLPGSEPESPTCDDGMEPPWPFAEGAFPFGQMPAWTPFWHPKSPFPPFPSMPRPKMPVEQPSVDPGTLRVEETIHGDENTGRYMVRRRSWTSGGVPQQEVMVISPPPTPTCEPGAEAQEVEIQEPEMDQAPQAAQQPKAPIPSEDLAPAGTLKGYSSASCQGVSVGVAVSADSHKGVQIQHHIEGDAARAMHGWAAASAGVSTDSGSGVRVYRYQGGSVLPPAGR